MKVILESRKTGHKKEFASQEEAEKFLKSPGIGPHKVAKPEESKMPPEGRKAAAQEAATSVPADKDKK